MSKVKRNEVVASKEVWVAAIFRGMAFHPTINGSKQEALEVAKLFAKTGERVIVWKAEEVAL